MIRFDTRNTKPKLYNIAILSAITVPLVVVLFLLRPAVPASVIGTVIAVYIAVVICLLVRAFFGQLRYNPYSYNTIYYMGFSLYLLSVFVTVTWSTVELFIGLPEPYSSVPGSGESWILSTLYASPRTYMLLSAPFILVFSVLLCISNIALLRHEGKRLVNFLGILLSFLMVGGEVFLFFADYSFSGSMEEALWHDILITLFSTLYLYYECMVIGAIVADALVARYEPDKDKDYIIILGCSIRKDGTLTPLLKGRVNRALGFYRKQEKATGKAPVLIPSGGQGSNEVMSESRAMANYLLEHGVPAEQIRLEERSTSTRENMLFSKEIIQAENPDAKIAFSTTNYHVFRSGMLARRIKMRAQGMGAKTKWYFWPNAAVREFVGLLTSHRLKQALILGSIIAIYIILTVTAYHYM